MKSDHIPKSGSKQRGESTGLPSQNTNANLNDVSERKFGGNFGMSPEKGGTAEKGYTREKI